MIYAREEEGETERNGVKKIDRERGGEREPTAVVMAIMVMVLGGGLVSMLEGIDSIEKSGGQ